MMLLKDSKVKSSVIMRKLLVKEPLRCRRLCEMGFLPGTKLNVAHRAPLGYPITVFLRGYTVILGKEDVKSIEVEAC